MEQQKRNSQRVKALNYDGLNLANAKLSISCPPCDDLLEDDNRSVHHSQAGKRAWLAASKNPQPARHIYTLELYSLQLSGETFVEDLIGNWLCNKFRPLGIGIVSAIELISKF